MKEKTFWAIFIMSMCSVFSLNAISKDISIQGGYKDFFSLAVEIVDAPSVGYTAGMPFDLMSSNINPADTEDGILIAKWSMLTNQPEFTFKVKCNSLKPVRDPVKYPDQTADPMLDPKNEIAYILTFKYQLSIYSGGNSVAMSPTRFMVASDGSVIDPTPRNPITGDTVYDSQSLLGTNAGEIYLKLTPDNYPTKLENAVDGDYQGLVTIVMEIIK